MDNYLGNLRREAFDNTINLFKLGLESRGGHTLYTSEFDNMCENYHRKACKKFEEDCDRYVENCPEMKEDILKCKEVHLRKLKDDLKEFKDLMGKVNKFKRDDNRERFVLKIVKKNCSCLLEYSTDF